MDKEFKDASLSLTLTMPKFNFEYEIQLNKLLQESGMVEAFDVRANFSRLTDVNIFIDKVIQKAIIEMNEAGSEAAATTVVSMNFSAISGGPLAVKYDEQFIFLLREASPGLILFMGQYNQP